MMVVSIAKIVELLQGADTKMERAELLKQHDCLALRGLLRMNFDSSLILALPEGAPPYTPCSKPDGYTETCLRSSAKRWSVFVKAFSPKLSQIKREKMFIDLLEKLPAKEAEILIQAKDRKLELGVTKKLVNEVFPSLIREEAKSHGKKNTAKNSNSSDC